MSVGHSHHVGKATVRALAWTLGLNAAFMVAEAVLGAVTGSLALLSDATHMLSDVAALGLALGATWLAQRPARPDRSFGLLRAEALGAFVNGLALIVIAGFIVFEAVKRATETTPDVAALPVLVGGVIGLAINLGSAWFLTRGGAHKENLNLRGALLHMIADALGSAAAIAAAVGIALGYPVADALASLVVAGIIAWSSTRLVRDTAKVLLEFAPPETKIDEVRAALGGLDGVEEVHDMHIWTLDGVHPLLIAHLVTDRNEALPEAIAMLSKRFHIEHATLQLEPAAGHCRGCQYSPHAH